MSVRTFWQELRPRPAVALIGAKGSLWTAAGMASSTGAGFAAIVVLVALSKPAAFADLAVLTIVVRVLSTLFRFGADKIFVGEYHAALATKGRRYSRDVGAGVLSFSILGGVMGGAILLLPQVAHAMSIALTSPLTPSERASLGIWIASETVRFVASEGHRARYSFVLAAVGGNGARAPIFLAMLLVLHARHVDLNRGTLLLSAATASGVVCVIALGSASVTYDWWKHNPLRSVRRLVGGHVANLLSTLAATLIAGSDVWIIGATMGTKTTASYAFSVQMVAGLSVLSSAIAGGLLPHIAQGLAARDSAAVERRVIRYVRFTSMLATVGYIGIAVLAPLIALHFGGRGYSGTLPLILILGAGQVLSTAAGLSGSVLTVARQYLVTTIITVGVAIYAVALEAASAYGLHQLILVAVVSGSSTVLLPMINNVALARILGIRTDFLARVGS